MAEQIEPYNMVVNPNTIWTNPLIAIGQAYGRAWQEQVDRQLIALFNDDYWETKTTYSGVGAKRRLYMKVKRSG